MIEPVVRGRALLDQIESTPCPTPTLWWLGHSGFVMKYRRSILYVDPYLSDSPARLTAAPLAPADITHAGLVLATHAHPGHLDPGTVPAILGASPRAKLVLPIAAADTASAMGIHYDRMVTTNAGLRVEFLDDRIYAVPAAHEKPEWSPVSGFRCLGYVVRFGNFTIYHAGDCAPYQDLAARLLPFNVNLALLPINGRGDLVPGNFEIAEAAQLAEEIGAEWVAPMHYDMFAKGNVDVNRFIDHMLGHRPSQRFKVFQCGEMWAMPQL